MTGTGTSTDPYIPTTWAEFVTAVGTSGAYVSVPEGTVWDMNEIAPNGIGTVNINARQIIGNGATIKNLYANGRSVFNYSYTSAIDVDGLNILNFLLENGACMFQVRKTTSGYADMPLRNIRCSGIVSDSIFLKTGGVYDNSYLRPSFHNSAFNLIFQGNSKFDIVKADDRPCAVYLHYCNVKFSGTSTNTDTTTTSVGHNAISFDNCLVTGNDPFKDICIDASTGSAAWLWHSYDSIFDINISSGQEISQLYSENFGTKCLLNSDKLGGTTIKATNISSVTSEQLLDAEYLQSIGFPIGVDEE